MNTECFKVKELIGTSFFQKIFKIKPKENAFIEINNLLAKKDIKDISAKEIITILEKYKISSLKNYYSHLEKMYEKYLNYCLSDKQLSDEEIEYLKKLKNILFLNDSQVDAIHSKIINKIYRMEVERVLKDGKLTEEEKNFLEKLKKDLKLSDEIARQIYGEKAKEVYKNYLNRALEDERLSPEEEKQLEEIANNLGITVTYDHQTKKTLEKYKLFWNIENGNLPEIVPDINIMKSEKCYFMKSNIKLYETRRITRRIRYAGPTVRIKIVKGVYWRMGDLGFQPVSEDVLTHIDTGTLYLTNKRLIFYGERKTTTIRLNKIIDFKPYQNGMKIIKETGKSPFFEFSEDIDLFSLILSKVLQEV